MSRCDIVIPIWNQLKLTKGCVESVEKNTSLPYRLIVIDNGSDHKTAEYLEDLKKKFGKKMILIKNAGNEGFIKAVNKGITLSRAEFVCILNNDTIAAPGWLEEAIKVFDEDYRIGIVNPSSNSLGQKIPKGIDPAEYGKNIKKESGLFVELGSAFGFCMIIKRKLFSEIGRLDEIYGVGNFDDTDFSLRAKREGYKIVRAIASYVYHREQASFNVIKNFKRNFNKNKEIFESRWGITKRAIFVLSRVNARSLKHLKAALKKHAKEKSWLYIISPPFETKEFFAKFSNLTFYHFGSFFFISAFLKILFKKKKPDVVYCDDKKLFSLLRASGFLHGAKLKMVEEK